MGLSEWEIEGEDDIEKDDAKFFHSLFLLVHNKCRLIDLLTKSSIYIISLMVQGTLFTVT